MTTISKGVQRFQAQSRELETEAKSENRNVTKREMAVALYEMVKSDKLSQADRKAAEKLLDTGIPLTRGAKDLVEGFSDGEQSSLLEVRLRGAKAAKAHAAGATEPAQGNERVYSSADRLEAMLDLFTDRGNRKLDTGEVDALAGFYGGLRSSSRAKIRTRMIEIYQKSEYSSGQKDKFRNLLERNGFDRAELEGVEPGTANGFHGMSDAAKTETLDEIWGEHLDFSAQYSALRDVQSGDLSSAAMAKIEARVAEFVASEQADLDRSGEDDPNVYRGDNFKIIHMVDDNGDPDFDAKIAVGYEVHQTFGNGGNTQCLFFELNGDYIGVGLVAEE